jgi:hypothetical protein
MDLSSLAALGKIAGVAGIAIGAVVLVRRVIDRTVGVPKAEQALCRDGGLWHWCLGHHCLAGEWPAGQYDYDGRAGWDSGPRARGRQLSIFRE